MRSLLSSLALLSCLAPAASASAQDDTDTGTTTGSSSGGIAFEVLTIGGEEVGLGELAVGIDDCLNNATIEIRLDGVPSEKESIDIYIGEGCNSTSRNETTNNTCRYVGNEPAGRTNDLTVELGVASLVADGADDECPEGESTPKIWLLAVDTPHMSEDVGTGYAMISTIRLDTRAPNAPTDIEGGSGERQIPVEWTTDDTDLERFIVLIDPMPTMAPGGAAGSTPTAVDGGTAPSPSGGGWNGECGSGVLTPNADLSSISTSVKRKMVNEATATHTELSSGDIDGTAAAVAVVAVDKAGNESPISELGCVYVVPTEGFWERYQQQPDAVDAGCPCRAIGAAHAQSGLPVMLALGWLARSARRRRSR
jgi:hypothetical protein